MTGVYSEGKRREGEVGLDFFGFCSKNVGFFLVGCETFSFFPLTSFVGG